MVRGYYSAASGVLSQQKSLNVISNNIANATTTGYKSQSTVESSFGQHLVSRMNGMEGKNKNNIGPGNFITVNVDEYTDFTQGSLENTGRAVDMAIQGKGFFLVESDIHGEVATRNGQFMLDDGGDLILPGVGRVLNANRNPIHIESSNFTVDGQGVIYLDGDEADTLFIAEIENQQFTTVGNGVYKGEEGFVRADTEAYGIMQGSIEKSNLNLAQEMSKIIAGQNHYQSCTQLLKIYDGINEITVNQIGRIG